MKQRYVFGPVSSRRLGQSLGIDPILGIDTIPLKTCNWNCVYCQLGRSRPMTNERREYVPLDALLEEAACALSRFAPGEIDWVTVVGSGEPTLYIRLGDLLRGLKALAPMPVAVITNGSLLYQPEVREALLSADAVLPSLDAGSPDLYRRVNRPLGELTFQRLVDGLMAFREMYTGSLWVEVMLLQDLNDSPEALAEIGAWLAQIRPDRVDITLPTRPPAEPWVRPASAKNVLRAERLLGQAARCVPERSLDLHIKPGADLGAVILALVTRHPVPVDELERTLGADDGARLHAALQELLGSGQALFVERLGRRYLTAAGAYYAD